MKSTLFTAFAVAALGLTLVPQVQAQEKTFTLPNAMSYAPSTRRDTWNTVLIVSGGLLVIGLIQSESTLAILGGAGVLVSLAQLNQNNFQGRSFATGTTLVSRGPMSFGLKPMEGLGAAPGFAPIKPNAYLSFNWKF